MIYPENFEQKTGFDLIRRMLHENCASTLGKGWVERMEFTSEYATISTLLDQTEEFRQIIITHDNFPLAGFYDPLHIFDRLKIEGTFAESDELAEIRSSLATIIEIIHFLKSRKDGDNLRYTALCSLTENLFVDPSIVKETDRIVDEKGEIRSGASPKLATIRRKLVQLETQAFKKIQQIFAQAKKEGWIDSNSELALRNGRQVIPVAAAYKRKIKGFIHDQSTTGQTVFIEPESVFETNNEIRQLELDERGEIVKILIEFAGFLRPHLPQLSEAYYFLGNIDFIRSKAKLAIELQATKPRLHSAPTISWVNARHPLLYLSHKAQKKKVEPLSIELAAPKTIMVISGPNAGGKSVCLKTVGLVQYMLQCGLHVPMEDHSDAGIFKDIFIDIGDEQSIENDLSTYSSHLANMRHFLRHCRPESLFLIDEFGSGTEPRLGGAIAEAILKELSEKKSTGVITTHYSNLKILAGKDPGIINGSMLFDTQNMRPIYRLKTGNPGSSFAFEIARTMGMPEHILIQAEKIAGSDHIEFDRQLQDLELKKLELDEKEKQLRSGDTFLAELIEKYQMLNEDLQKRKNEIIVQAKIEAKKMLAETNSVIEKTIREIRESSAEKATTNKLRDEIRQLNNNISVEEATNITDASNSKKSKKKHPKKEEKHEVLSGPIVAGDYVRIKGQDTAGVVVEVTPKIALVAFGSVQMKIAPAQLERLNKKSIKSIAPASRIKYDFDINEKAAEFKPSLDIRGQRVNDALSKVSNFIDDAILLGSKNLKIVHGTGNGILREAIRDYVRNLPQIKTARDEHPDRGGAGCTLLDLSAD